MAGPPGVLEELLRALAQQKAKVRSDIETKQRAGLRARLPS